MTLNIATHISFDCARAPNDKTSFPSLVQPASHTIRFSTHATIATVQPAQSQIPTPPKIRERWDTHHGSFSLQAF